jgi:hypothetical protein
MLHFGTFLCVSGKFVVIVSYSEHDRLGIWIANFLAALAPVVRVRGMR